MSHDSHDVWNSLDLDPFQVLLSLFFDMFLPPLWVN